MPPSLLNAPKATPTGLNAPPTGIEEQLTELFQEEDERLSGVVIHLLGPRVVLEDVHEAMQNAFLRCWQRREHMQEVRDLRAFVYTAVLNAARDLARKRERRREVDLVLAEDVASSFPAPITRAARREEIERLRRIVAGLGVRDREVFLLRQNGELTYAQVAEILGVPIGTVKARMRRALGRIRAMLEPRPKPPGEGSPREVAAEEVAPEAVGRKGERQGSEGSRDDEAELR